MNIDKQRASFEAWYESTIWGNEDFKSSLGIAYTQGYQAALQSQKPEPNNLMLSAVIRMPFKMAMADPISRMQFYQRAQQALNELEALQHSCKETSQDREDAERFRFCLENGFPQKWEEMFRGSLRYYWTSRPGSQEEFSSAVEAIDHARRVEEDGTKCS